MDIRNINSLKTSEWRGCYVEINILNKLHNKMYLKAEQVFT